MNHMAVLDKVQAQEILEKCQEEDHRVTQEVIQWVIQGMIC